MKSVPCILARFSKTHAQMLLSKKIEIVIYTCFHVNFPRDEQVGRRAREQNGCEGEKYVKLYLKKAE